MLHLKHTPVFDPIEVGIEPAEDGTIRVFFDEVFVGFFQQSGRYLKISIPDPLTQARLQAKGISILDNQVAE